MPITTIASDHLDLASRLRLRAAFHRWTRNPAAFSNEIAAAELAISAAETHGYHLRVDCHGIPTAIKPESMVVTKAELKRFEARCATMTDPAEKRATLAALSACKHRGFTARVTGDGRLVATPPRQCERVHVDLAKAKRDHKAFQSRTGGQSAFKRVPATIL